MSRTVAVYQPRYLPQLHYLARAASSDAFVILDDVPFSRQSPQHRAPIKHGSKRWLTIPIRHCGEQLISEAVVDASQPWAGKHISRLRAHFGQQADVLKPFYEPFRKRRLDISWLTEHRDAVDAVGLSEAADGALAADESRRMTKRRLDTWRERKNRYSRLIKTAVDEGHQEEVQAAIDRSRRMGDRIEELEAQLEQVQEHLTSELREIRRRLPSTGRTEQSERLVDLTIPLLAFLFDRFDICTEVYRSSCLSPDRTGDPSEYNARLVDHLDGDEYLSGRTGYESYLNEATFDTREIEVSIQDWEPPWPDGNVCALEVLFDSSVDRVKQYVR